MSRAMEEEQVETGEKRPAEEGEDEQAAKQAKVDLNPLTGAPYTHRFYELLERRQKLPAWSAREDFLRLMQVGQVVIMVGDTGCGKTTQLPQILLDAGYHVQNGEIKALACVQPHSLGATCAASRVAEELEVPIGSYVGYNVKWDDKTSVDTLLRMTSAEALLREALVDPSLSRYSVILIDEAHTRTAAIDTLLGLLKRALGARPELKLVVMSASLDIRRMQNYFGGAPLLQIPGTRHPVEVHYLSSSDKDYLKAAVRTVVQIHSTEPEGDILVFLANEEDIDSACAQLRREALRLLEFGELVTCPLHASSTPLQASKAFEVAPVAKVEGGRPGRKVVVATEVAETSIALEGIVYVVDPGFERQHFFNPRTRLETSHAAPVSRVAQERRALRAGRSAPGKCFRLYAEKASKDLLPDFTYPEIMRTNLTSMVLLLKRLGIEDLVHFEFLDPPPPEALMRAFESLHHLGCLDDDGDVTEEGDKVSKFPVDPQLAKMLVDSPRHRCSNEALSIAAMLCVRPVFLRPTGSARQADDARGRFAHLDGDHLTLLNVFHAYKQHVQDGVEPTRFCGENYLSVRAMSQAEIIREQLGSIMVQIGLPMLSTDFNDKEYYPNIRRCLISGFFMQVAHLDKVKLGLYLTVREAEEVSLHPSSCLGTKPEWILFDEFLHTSRDFIRVATQVHGEWLFDVAPGYYEDLTRFPKETRGALERAMEKRKKAEAQ